MKTRKRFLKQVFAMVLALALGVSTLRFPVWAEEGKSGQEVESVQILEEESESPEATTEDTNSSIEGGTVEDDNPTDSEEAHKDGEDNGGTNDTPVEIGVIDEPEEQSGVGTQGDALLEEINTAFEDLDEDTGKDADELYVVEEEEELVIAERFEQLSTPPTGYTPIYTAAEFNAIRDQPNKNYILMNDIDLSGYHSWAPIQGFSGILDGNGYSIKNMSISKAEKRDNVVYIGLFGETTGNVTIKRIRSLNGSVQLDARFGTDDSCNVFRYLNVGGLVGKSSGTTINISDVCCHIDIKIILTKNDINDFMWIDTYIGGVIGDSSQITLNRVCNYGDIEITDNSINNSPGRHTTCIGGIAGTVRTEWYGSGDKKTSTIRNVYNAGNVSLKGIHSSSSEPCIGGISGYVNKVFGEEEWRSEDSHMAEIIIENIFNVGRIQSENADADKGELFGVMFGWDITRPKSYEKYINCYCLMGKNGIGAAHDADFTEIKKDPTKKLTASQMRSKSSFAGFKFNSIWEMGPDHPVLMGVASPYTYKPAKYEDGTPFPYSFRAAQDAKKGENGFGERNDTAVFRPAYFSSDSTEYNQSLALFSLQLALSAFNKTDSDKTGYTTAADNVTSFLENMGCEGIQLNRHSGYYGNYVYNMQPRANSIGLAAGHRPIKVNGKIYNLVVMAIRGGGYEAEWAGNFRVGTGSHHSGFYDAASEAYRFLDDYITRQGITGDVKILVSGYSRAAATANILGGAFLDNGKNKFSNGTFVPTDNIYVYTFETPKGVIKNSQLNPNAKKFDNIFNIINPDDPVPKLAPNAWGFVRYGVDCFIQTSYGMDFSGVEKQYYKVVGDPKNNREKFKKPYNIQSWYLDKLVNSIAHSFGILIPTPLSERDDYVFHFQDDIVAGCEQAKNLDGESILRALLGDDVAVSRIAVLAVSFLKPSLKKKITIAIAIIGEMAFETVNLNNGADFDRLFFFHYPELCLAWMKYITDSDPDEHGDSFWSGRYKNINLKCPVDAIIYIGGRPVAEIRDEEVISQTDGIVYADVDAFGQKSFYLMTDAEYEIVVNAHNDGKMDAVVTEYSLSDGVTEQTVFFDMPLTEGQTFNTSMHGGSVDTDVYQFTTGGNTIVPDDILSGDRLGGTIVEVAVDGNGEVFGSGEYTKGDLATLYAIPDEGYDLVGWKNPVTDEWLSREEQYGFIVKENTSITAVFAREVGSIDLDKDYLMVKKGETQTVKATTDPEIWAQFIEKSVRTEAGGEVIEISEVSAGDEITAKTVGTAYVEYRLKTPKKELLAECRVDVYEDESEKLEEQLDGVRLKNTAAASNLYSTDYTKVELLPLLKQNNQMRALNGNAYSAERFPAGVEDAKVALEEAAFTDEQTAAVFSLRIADDNTVEIVPTPDALENPGTVKAKYQSAIRVRVGAETFETQEKLTLTVKKTLPVLKAKQLKINSFYTRTDYSPDITGGTVLSVKENPERAGNIPDWITFTGTGAGIRLTGTAPEKWSGTLYLSAKVKGWTVDVPFTQKVSIARTNPALKLSAKSVTLQEDFAHSNGAPLTLLSRNKKVSLASLGITGLSSGTTGYAVEDFDPVNGTFVLKADRVPVDKEKVTLQVQIKDAKSVPLTLSVKVKNTVKIKASKKSVALNPALTVDQAEVRLTCDPADYVLTDETVSITVTDAKNNLLNADEWLDLDLGDNKLSIRPVYRTPEKDTTVKVKLRGKHAADQDTVISVKLYGGKNAEPSVKLSAKGAIDLSVPSSSVIITPSFKNYSGLGDLEESFRVAAAKGKTPPEDVTDLFAVIKSANGSYSLSAVDGDKIDSSAQYSVTFKYEYDASVSGTGTSWLMASNAQRFTVKQSKVSVKPSKSTVTLNANVHDADAYDTATVTLTPSVKGALIEDLTWNVTKGKSVAATEELTVSYDAGVLKLSANDKTAAGTSYTVAFGIKGNPTAGKITVKTVKADVKPAVSLTQKGTLDVIRPGSAVTLSPRVTNVSEPALGSLSFGFTATNNGVPVDPDDIQKQFVVTEQDGKYQISAAENATLHTSKAWKYYVAAKLTIGETTIESKALPLKIRAGKAKVIADKKTVTLYAQDRYSEEVIQVTVPDQSLSEIAEIKVNGDGVPFEVTDLGGGYLSVGFKNRNAVKKGQSIKLNIYFKGNTDREKPDATLSLKVAVK